MRLIHILGLAGALAAGVASAHEGHDPNLGKGTKPPPLAVLQLDEVRNANAKYLDEQKAIDDGFQDIGLFVPNMGWHYRNLNRVDGHFDVTRPEFLVYADDPCGGKRKLVAVEYVVPFEDARRAPEGFFGKADQWDANQTFQLWTLHAWLYEYNPDGVFAPFNPRVP
ncbi:MAG TPA: hypothetical protein VFS13_04480 [Steroidobacteraceae bacterium]|jgi:hypothetical protein|nr:hypothetical protein [Steroidobacteraceae bacterium]